MLWEYKPNTVIGGTPKGKGQFFELSLRGQDPTQQEYKFFNYSSFDNPYLDTKALEEDMKSMPERVVQQEIYAQFLEDTGVVFRGVREIATATPEKPKPNNVYVMGVDLAKVQDWTVIAVYDRKTNEQVYQDRFKTLEWPFQKKKIKAVSRHYNNALVVLDATGLGDPIADDLIRDGVPVEPYKLTNQSKKELIEKLSVLIEQKRIKILNIEDTIAELNSFTYDVTNSGRITYNAPVGFNDDIVIAHGLAVWSLTPLYPEPNPEPVSLIQREYRKLTQRGDDSVYEFVSGEDYDD